MSYFSKKILENCPKIHKRQHFLKMLKQRELFFEQERRLQQYVHRNANLTKVISDLIFRGTQTFGSSCVSVFFEGLSAPVCYISQNASCIFSNIKRKVLFFVDLIQFHIYKSQGSKICFSLNLQPTAKYLCASS